VPAERIETAECIQKYKESSAREKMRTENILLLREGAHIQCTKQDFIKFFAGISPTFCVNASNQILEAFSYCSVASIFMHMKSRLY